MGKISFYIVMGVFSLSAAIPIPVSTAGTVKLWGNADGDSSYIEEPSDAFIRVDLYDPPPRETQQRFHAISDPSVTFGNLMYDGFPNDERFRMGSIDYDDSALVGGSGTAPITALRLGVAFDPDDPSYFNYYRWVDNVTVVDSFSGTVTVSAGQVTAIDLNSNVHLEVTIFSGTVIEAPGTFAVAGDLFTGTMEYAFDATQSLIWDFAGTLTTLATAHPGDFDLDGDVDGNDFLVWQRGEGNPTGLADWQENYGNPALPPEPSTAVPEPSTLIAFLMALSASLFARH